MFDNVKNLKIVKKIQERINPKYGWLSFANKSKLDKSTIDYLEAVSGVEDLSSVSEDKELEAMVRSQLKEEFPGIENKKSYELLVDAVMHKMKSNELKAQDSNPEIE